jgi:saccharopine dehydrogenase-like NADP-dependent oxidoreductase
MRSILILGAGRSSASLIDYLLEQARLLEWTVVVGDVSEEAAKQKLGNSSLGGFIHFDAMNEKTSLSAVSKADVVISLLPPNLHPVIARYCLDLKKHLVTASYVSAEMKTFSSGSVANDLLFLNECGLDPGIDHMSAMQIIDRIRNAGGSILSFESFTGGLIAPETAPDNPWRYKFTWNPRNVVMAGHGTAKYLQNGKFKYIPYQKLFKRISSFDVSGYGTFEGYANRDSLKYINTYGLSGIKTLLRGTLRYPGFCEAWDIFVQLGCSDDSYHMEGVRKMSHRDFIASFLPEDRGTDLHEQIKAYLGLTSLEGLKKVDWSGLFDEEPVGMDAGTPAQILEHILNKKWKLVSGDIDLIVMQHRLIYELDGKRKQINASLTCKGDDSIYTAMAKTVGLPLGIATKLLLTDKIKARGVVMPVTSEFYTPVLRELGQHGIEMFEEEI